MFLLSIFGEKKAIPFIHRIVEYNVSVIRPNYDIVQYLAQIVPVSIR